MLKMSTFDIDTFLHPVLDTLAHSATQIPVRTNVLKRIIDEILQLWYSDRLHGVNLIFYHSPEKKSIGVKSGERGGHSMLPLRPIQ